MASETNYQSFSKTKLIPLNIFLITNRQKLCCLPCFRKILTNPIISLELTEVEPSSGTDGYKNGRVWGFGVYEHSCMIQILRECV